MSALSSIKKAGISLAVASVLGLSSNAFAAGDPVISDIQIRGLNRVTKGAVLMAMPVKVGDVMTSENTAETMRQLYATGEFDDVKLSRDGNTFIVTVQERPTVGAIDFSGNSNIQKEELMKVIESQGIRVGDPLDNQALNTIKRSMEDFYHSSGMYQATVNPVITQLPRNRADIKIEIIEGKAAEIQQINIVGNKAFDEEVLLAQMQLRDDVPWWNIMANSRYDSQKFRADLESLKTFYMDRGYVNFKIDSTSVEVTPDKKGIFLTIVIDEGDQYRIASTSVGGDTLNYQQELSDAVTVEAGDVYNQRLITENEKTLTAIMGKYGYANTEVRALPIYNDNDKTIDLQFNVQPGKRVNVSQVFINGNSTTDDTVIRREIRQMDGSWLSSEAIEVSKTRLDRTGYFEEVKMDTEAYNNSADTVNVKTTVKERPTGSITGGIGFGTDSGFTIQAGISQTNLFGKGLVASFISYKNKYRRHFEASLTDPYFTVDNISLGGKIYLDNYYGDDDSNGIDYTTRTIGATGYLGYPLSETLTINYSLGVENSKVKNRGLHFQQGDEFFRMYSKDGEYAVDFVNYRFGIELVRNTLDRKVFPTSGSRQVLGGSIMTPNSDLHYYKTTVETYHYFPLNTYHDYIFAIRGKAGYGNGYRKKNGKTEMVPFFDNFSLGGSDWLRGFSRNSVGPRALYQARGASGYYESNNSVGGNAFWAATAEIVFPTPLIAEAYKNSVRTALFFDAGSLWDTRSKDYAVDYSKSSEYRTSAGISLTWMSPIGPLSFNLARAIKKYDRDDTQVFNFNIGGSF